MPEPRSAEQEEITDAVVADDGGASPVVSGEPVIQGEVVVTDARPPTLRERVGLPAVPAGAAAVAAGALAGAAAAAAVVVATRGKSQPQRRGLRQRQSQSQGLPIVGTRSYLVDVHLLAPRDGR